MKPPEEFNFPEGSFEDNLMRIARVPMGDADEEPEFQDVPTSLVPIRSQAGELLIDSRHVAAVFGITHRAVFRIISENKESMESLGQLRFHRTVGKRDQGGGNPMKYAFLNFDQVAFLLTLTKTTELTKDLRLKLILAFKEARERLRPVDQILLAIPDAWKKTFPDTLYIALLRVYGAEFDKEKNNPSWVGAWTNRFIYDPVYEGLSDELKRKRNQFVDATSRDPKWIRLHQFLEVNAKDLLKETIAKITAILQISRSKQDFAEHYATMMGGALQFRMDELLDPQFS